MYIVIHTTYEHQWVYTIPHKYVGHFCEAVKIYKVVTTSSGYLLHAADNYCILLVL